MLVCSTELMSRRGGGTWGVGHQPKGTPRRTIRPTPCSLSRLVVASPTCREQPSLHGFDGALTLREQAGSAASCSCRRCAPWPIMMDRQCRQGSNIMAAVSEGVWLSIVQLFPVYRGVWPSIVQLLPVPVGRLR